MKKEYGALVVGAGIGGIRSALDLAETGLKVALIDARPSLGGILAQLDHQFPSDHCGMCKMLPLTQRDQSSQYCLRKGLFHKNIDIYLSTELAGLEGDPGKFQATLSRRSTFVDPTRCVSCGLCAEVCPARAPSEFNAGLKQRTAVYLPVPHNIPNHYVVDLDTCQRCWRCHEACPTKAIDFKFEQRKDFHIIVATPDQRLAQDIPLWFKDEGFPLHPTSSGEDALKLLAEGLDCGLMLLDLDLPTAEAERTLRRALELRPSLAVVLLASKAQNGDKDGDKDRAAAALLKLGAREVLAKPLGQAQVVPWLDKLFMRLVSDESFSIEAGAVILAAGFECYDPAASPGGSADLLLYGSHPGVLTSLEFERLASPTGPSQGHLTRPGDGKPLKRIAWLQCVGSRDVKKQADFCSSFCCMVSIKQALLSRRRSRGEVETAIFYMDMRTNGRDYQRYRDEAENEAGVRFVPARPHTILPGPDGDILVQYFDYAGELREEVFDALVLAVGARPPRSMERLAQAAGIEVNESGFCATRSLSPNRTSRLGVFAAGAFGEPADIRGSLIQAGAAAMGASRMIRVYHGPRDETPEAEPEYTDVSRQVPRVLMALCTSCPTLERNVDSGLLHQRMAVLPGVVKVVDVKRACTREGWDALRQEAELAAPNRVLIGACLPYVHVPRLRELGEALRLNPALMDVVDIHTASFAGRDTSFGGHAACRASCAAGSGEEHGVCDCGEASRTKEMGSLLAMAAAKLLGADPSALPKATPVSPQALVVGGGLAGMTAAMGIADQGFKVVLVEETEHLGGQAMNLRYTLEGDDPARFMEDLVEQVEKNPNIRVLKDSRVVLSRGKAGRFVTVIATGEGVAHTLHHGATILATGGHEAKVYEYGNRVHKCVITQLELEQRLAAGSVDASGLKGVAMIQCWRSREESRNYCSRVCCQGALKNILMLKKRNPGLPVYVFYRDIMTTGFAERYYTEARRSGAIFIRYAPDSRPKVTFKDDKPVITALDPVLGAEIELNPDLLVLSSGVEPGDAAEIADLFGVGLTPDGFFQEAESKWRPVDFLKHGVFACGLALGPATMRDSLLSAKAAAQRVVRILSEKQLSCGNVVAEVRDTLCARCGRCISVCPYGARALDLDRDRIVVDELLCQGCGSCMAACPNSATVLRGFRDEQVMAVIDAALAVQPSAAAGL
ncbi:MAG: FAD-dependent oxidoreductase [Proteobacteria bacterium]|nr:FAD-dependent oxidoreductase [Pseudomonadota bacterium]MBU1594845.1 FAD-dependent oxidoreductase [Pseudomonadota bacterium]